MHRRLALLVVTGLALAGCSGDPSQVPRPTMTASPTPTVEVADGIAAPEALRDLDCRADEQGRWSAKGSVRNDSKAPRTFTVVVQVGPGGDSVSARRLTLRDVPPRTEAPFEVDRVPTSSDAGPCHVQVVTVS